jgi:peptide/nickel transport system permease protein
MDQPAATEWKTPWQRLRSHRRFWLLAGFLGFLALVAIFADVLANSAPLYVRYQGKTYFPAFQSARTDTFQRKEQAWVRRFDQVNWQEQKLDAVIWAPVPFGREVFDAEKLQPPGSIEAGRRHWLGTRHNGGDLLASMIRACRVSLLVGLLAAGLSGLIALLVGAIAGFLGDDRVRVSVGGGLGLLLGLFPAWFYGFHLPHFFLLEGASLGTFPFLGRLGISLLVFGGILTALFWLGNKAEARFRLPRSVALPLDTMLVRVIEWLQVLPLLLLVLAISSIFKQADLWLVMLIIGLAAWPGLAMLVRGQILAIRERDYIAAAQALGFSQWRILWRQVVPNALPPILIAFSTSIGGAILLESALSFLQIVHESDSWGGLLNEARGQQAAWWLGVFPGLAIFLTVLSVNLLAELARDAWDPRHRSRL